MHGFGGLGTHLLYLTPSLHVKVENQIPNSSEYASSLVLVHLPFVLQGRGCLIFLPPALHRRTKACEPGSSAITIFSAGLPKKQRTLVKVTWGKAVQTSRRVSKLYQTHSYCTIRKNQQKILETEKG